MPTCEEFYKELNVKCNEILSQSFREDTTGLHSQSHNFLQDMERWISVLQNRLEIPLLTSAQKEYQFGLLSLVQGQYRQAYMALRLFLEQALAAVHFSVNELELRRWLSGHQDIFWQSIIDEDNGVFSRKFIEVFCPTLLDEIAIYREMARSVYRECSEYIHANIQTHRSLPETLEFNKEVFHDWHEKAEAARIVTMFAFCGRYLITLKEVSEKQEIESCVIEYVGHLGAIRTFF